MNPFARIRAWLNQPVLEQLDIMSKAITDFVAKQSAHNLRLETSLAGIEADITALNDKIAALQTSPGEVTPEDQALLDQLTAQGEALATKFDALNALTPPPVPPV